jgi:hypothetical protein
MTLARRVQVKQESIDAQQAMDDAEVNDELWGQWRREGGGSEEQVRKDVARWQ